MSNYSDEEHDQAADARIGQVITTNRGDYVARVYATDRAEHETCQAGTTGCAINHAADQGGCGTW